MARAGRQVGPRTDPWPINRAAASLGELRPALGRGQATAPRGWAGLGPGRCVVAVA